MSQPTRAERLATAKSADIYLRPRGTRTLTPATMVSHNPLYRLRFTRDMERHFRDPTYRTDIVWGDLILTTEEARAIFERDGLIPARDPAPDPQPSGQILVDDLEEAPAPRSTKYSPEMLDSIIEAIRASGSKITMYSSPPDTSLDSGPGPTTEAYPGLADFGFQPEYRQTAIRQPCKAAGTRRTNDEAFLRSEPSQALADGVIPPKPKTAPDGDWFPLQGRLTLEQVEQLRDLSSQDDLTSDNLIDMVRKLEEWGVTVV
jgi:hypothetical protein